MDKTAKIHYSPKIQTRKSNLQKDLRIWLRELPAGGDKGIRIEFQDFGNLLYLIENPYFTRFDSL